MAITDKLMSIGIITISISAGFIFFYMMSDFTKEKKKILIEEMGTQLINFIIFIWVGKIILNFSIFITDPLAILAYPSTSKAFYLAILLSTTVLFYKSKRQKIDLFIFIESFLPVFLAASFLYEFIQLVWNNNNFSLTTIQGLKKDFILLHFNHFFAPSAQYLRYSGVHMTRDKKLWGEKR